MVGGMGLGNVTEYFSLESYAMRETLRYEVGEVDGGVYAEGGEF
jgi:hypothetical protein